MGDLRDLRDRFRRAKVQIGPATQRDLVWAGEQVQKQMQQYAPVDTGYLRDHIQLIVSPGSVRVGPVGVDYDAAVEYGTKPHTIRAKPGKTLAFKMNGRTIFVKSVRHPGTRAQPYIRPARQWAEKELPQKIALTGASFLKDN